MPKVSELQQTIDQQADVIEQVDALVDEALDAELSREDVIGKLKEISELVSEEESEGEESGE